MLMNSMFDLSYQIVKQQILWKIQHKKQSQKIA